jgi:hypothetical protein
VEGATDGVALDETVAEVRAHVWAVSIEGADYLVLTPKKDKVRAEELCCNGLPRFDLSRTYEPVPSIWDKSWLAKLLYFFCVRHRFPV